jgi:hypothetical protein
MKAVTDKHIVELVSECQTRPRLLFQPRLLFLWKKLGFSIVGTLPKAFRHKRLGYIDAYVMYELLQDPDHCPIADDAPGG